MAAGSLMQGRAHTQDGHGSDIPNAIEINVM